MLLWQAIALLLFLIVAVVESQTSVGDVILATLQPRVENLFQAHRNLAETIDNTVTSLQLSYPFVSVPNWEDFGYQLRSQVPGLQLTAFVPLVNAESRTTWIAYSTELQDWIAESFEAEVARGVTRSHGNSTISNDIFELNYTDFSRAVVESSGLYGPMWQTSPPPIDASLVNYDMLSLEWVDAMIPSLQEARVSSILRSEDGLALIQNVIGISESDTTDLQQLSAIVQPIFAGGQILSGFLFSFLDWQLFLSNLSPSPLKVLLVLKNTCGYIFTYSIDGNETSYLGEGDRRKSISDEPLTEIPLYENSESTVAPNIADYCQYTLSVYDNPNPTSAPTSMPQTTSPTASQTKSPTTSQTTASPTQPTSGTHPPINCLLVATSSSLVLFGYFIMNALAFN